MKNIKLAAILIALAFLVFTLPIVSAVDIPPVVTLTADVDRTTTTAVITATASDPSYFDNAGVAWIKLYEDGELIKTKDCNYDTICTVVEVVVKTSEPGTYTYRAEALDKGGHTVAEEVNVRFAGVDEIPPQYDNIVATPPSPAPYGIHNFSVTWTDNSRIGNVWIEHNFFGTTFTAPVTSHVGDVYYYDIDEINLGTYQWRMTAEDVADQGPNTNSTPWQDYTVVRTDVNLTWQITPGVDVNYGTQTSVSCAVSNPDNTETPVVLGLFRNGTAAPNPDTAVLDAGTYVYTCSASETAHYNAVSETRTIVVNPIGSGVNLLINGADADVAGVERMYGLVDITGTLVTGENGLELYIDGELADSGNSPLSHPTNFFTSGDHNITLVGPQTTNYISSFETHWVNVVDTINPESVTGLTALGSTLSTIDIEWTNPADDDFAGVMVSVDGVYVDNATGTTYTVGNLSHDTTYTITLHTYDNDSNINTTDVNLTASTLPDVTNPVINVITSPSDSVYAPGADYEFVAAVTDNQVDTVELEVNGVNQTVSAAPDGLYKVNLTDLPEGFYEWRLHANDTTGNSASTALENFTVSKAASAVNLTLNSAKQNITAVGSVAGVNVAAERIAGEGNIEVFEDGISLYSGVGPYTASRDYTTVGDHNVTLVYAETQNYTSSEEVYFVFVQPIIRNVSLVDPADMTTDNTTNAVYTITVINTGNVPDNYTLTRVNENSAATAALNQTAIINLGSLQSADVTLTVGDPALGQYNVTVNIVSDNDAAVSDTILVTTIVTDFSTIINSWVNGVYYPNNQTATVPQVFVSTVVDSTVTHVDTDINNSQVYRSTIDNSLILASSQINDSTLLNATIQNGAMVTANSVVENSTVDSSTVTNSIIRDTGVCWDMLVDQNSVVDNSNIADSVITNSKVYDSSFSCAYLVDSGDTVINSDITGSVMNNVTIIDSNATWSTLTNVNISGSDVNGSTVTDSVVTNSIASGGSVITDNAVVTNSNIDNSNIANSTIINSDIPDGTTVDDAVIQDGVIMNGTVDGTLYTTPTNLTEIVNYAPVAGISASATTIYEGTSVSFTSTSTDVNIGTDLNDSLTYDWSVGAAQFSTNSTASRVFSSKGTYIVTLIVTDSFGAFGTETVAITVNEKSTTSSSSSGSRRSTSPTGRIITLIDLVPGAFLTIDLYDGDLVKFTFDSQEYQATFRDIAFENTEISIAPTDLDIVVVEKLKTENINLNGDMLNDISISYDGFIEPNHARFTFGMKEAPAYEPIVVPGQQPGGQEGEEGDSGITGGVVIDLGDEGPGLWQRLVEWLKRLFGMGEDESEETAEEEAEEPEQEEQAEEDEEEAPAEEAVEEETEEAEDEEKEGFWQRVASWFSGDDKEEEQVESEVEEAGVEVVEDEDEGQPSLFLGILLVFLVGVLGVSVYFLVRKEIMERRIRKYL